VHPAIQAHEPLAPLREPLLIGAFIARGGFSASAAIGHLIAQWDARPVADIDPDHYYDFSVLRPHVRLEGGARRLDWPETRFFVASPPGSDRDLVLLTGVEPHYHWRDFTNAVNEVAERLGVRESVLVSVRPGPTPHRRPIPLELRDGDEAVARRFGVEATRSDYQGPTTITGVLSLSHREKGWRGGVLGAVRPFYIGVEPSPHAVAAVCEAIARGIGAPIDTGGQRDAATEIDRHVAAAMEQSEELAAFVQELEGQYDAAHRGRPALSPPTPQLDSAEILADIERLLREHHAPGQSETPRTH